MSSMIGGILQGVGSGATGLSQKTAADASANALDYSASLADQNAQIEKDQANADSQTIQKNLYRQIGAQRTAAAASGVGVDGSVLDVLEETNRQGAVDVQRRQYQGALAARSANISANLDRFYAKAGRKTRSILGAASAANTGASVYNTLSQSSSPKTTKTTNTTASFGSGGMGGFGDSYSTSYGE